MIGFLRGLLIQKQPSELLLEVQGVGYEIAIPLSVFCALPPVNHEMALFIHHHVREDGEQLFGFITSNERLMFRTLLKVSGIGPKSALAILSKMEPHALVSAVQRNDLDTLVRLPGVGKKTAERLVLDLRDRLKDWTGSLGLSADPLHANNPTPESSVPHEAVAALLTLGYKENQAQHMVAQAQKQGAASLEDLVRAALTQAHVPA